MKNPERTAEVLFDNARDAVEGLSEKPAIKELLDFQAEFILSLADSALYAFSAHRDELVEKAYGLFLKGVEALDRRGLLINEPGLGLWLAPLKDLNPERGFSIDRRFSLLWEPKPTMVWTNRVVQLRNALHGRPARDPMRGLGYGIERTDRRFPVLLKAIRRLYELFPPYFDKAMELVFHEIEAGVEVSPLYIRNGSFAEIEELPEDLESTIINGKEVFYSSPSKKTVHFGLKSIELGEIDALYIKKGKRFLKIIREGF